MKRDIPWYGWIVIILMGVLFATAVGLFAWQTWEFVNFLLPTENWLMKYLAVANFDVMSITWFMAELFLRKYLTNGAKTAMIIAGGNDFVLSTIATVIQLTIVASLRFDTAINPVAVYVAYGTIVLALVVNIITFIIVIKSQWPFIIGEKVYSPIQPQANKIYSPNQQQANKPSPPQANNIRPLATGGDAKIPTQ
jgi:hypothetical protein